MAEPAAGLERVRQQGEIRQLGIRYAHFVLGPDEGLEVEMTRRFAARLGVRHVLVESDWNRILQDLLGREVIRTGAEVELGASRERRGDLIATGLTVLPWREKVVRYSRPTFPTQIWLVAPAGSGLSPIVPQGNLDLDIAATRALLQGQTVLAKAETCLAPELHNLEATGAEVRLFEADLKFLAAAVLAGKADTTILDVPDVLVALRHYPSHPTLRPRPAGNHQ